jgi:hypothetical protein
MNKLLFTAGALTFAALVWMVIYDGVNRHMAEYQECGYKYCEPQDPTKGGK